MGDRPRLKKLQSNLGYIFFSRIIVLKGIYSQAVEQGRNRFRQREAEHHSTTTHFLKILNGRYIFEILENKS